MSQLFCGDHIIFWPTNADGKATGEVVILSYPEDGTNRIECGCRKQEPEAVKETP